jgi:hypothetical protein
MLKCDLLKQLHIDEAALTSRGLLEVAGHITVNLLCFRTLTQRDGCRLVEGRLGPCPLTQLLKLCRRSLDQVGLACTRVRGLARLRLAARIIDSPCSSEVALPLADCFLPLSPFLVHVLVVDRPLKEVVVVVAVLLSLEQLSAGHLVDLGHLVIGGVSGDHICQP